MPRSLHLAALLVLALVCLSVADAKKKPSGQEEELSLVASQRPAELSAKTVSTKSVIDGRYRHLLRLSIDKPVAQKGQQAYAIRRDEEGQRKLLAANSFLSSRLAMAPEEHAELLSKEKPSLRVRTAEEGDRKLLAAIALPSAVSKPEIRRARAVRRDEEGQRKLLSANAAQSGYTIAAAGYNIAAGRSNGYVTEGSRRDLLAVNKIYEGKAAISSSAPAKDNADRKLLAVNKIYEGKTKLDATDVNSNKKSEAALGGQSGYGFTGGNSGYGF